MNKRELWDRYKQHLCLVDPVGLELDISRMMFDDSFLATMGPPMADALRAMEQLERGAIANADENRMVGHYWLRAPQLAPDEQIRSEIEECTNAVKQFVTDLHNGTIAPQRGDGFYVVLLIGIGGSALGPQFICDALGGVDDPMLIRFLDNTDPDGIDRVLDDLDETLAQTLTVVVSKSGGTIETRNAMLETAERYRRSGLDFAKHAVAITCEGSTLHHRATDQKWLRIFPMWDWVGGRNSVMSAVGLLPAALTGVDTDELLCGAAACDTATRSADVSKNPAALLALMWYYAVEHRGRRNMVVMPYRDRLALLPKYLQQLVMESLGKEVDRAGRVVNQGLTLYGHKGSTDQHAYVQQLREGVNDFFATFIDVRRDRAGQSLMVEDGVTCGDYLCGFQLGTRDALVENGRESITITLDKLNAASVGALIALFERAVGLYAELININAYHQPGVEAGKKAAAQVIELQHKVLAHLRSHAGASQTVEEIAAAIGEPDGVETIHRVLTHAASNDDHNIARESGDCPFDTRYTASPDPRAPVVRPSDPGA